MSEHFSLNDTFDGISFSESGRVKNGNTSQEHRKGKNEFDLKQQNNENLSVSIDDSIFLNESFTFSAEQNSHERNISSQDIFNASDTSADLLSDTNNKELANNSKVCVKFVNDHKTSSFEQKSQQLLTLDIKENVDEIHHENQIQCIKSSQDNLLKANNKGFISSNIKCHKLVDDYKNITENEGCCINNDNKSILKDTSQHTVTLDAQNINQIHHEVKKQLVQANRRCKLSDWNLPEEILRKYESQNIKEMFSWQCECLENDDILHKNKNLVYSAPTSAGKTLVSEILAIKTLVERNKKVIFILPFISVVREKMFYFKEILDTSGIRVEGFMGSYNPPGGFQTVQLAICTIEKANSLINRLLEENKLSDIGSVIVDEMHLLGDPSRGYLLELLLTKLNFMSVKHEDVNIQIIGMSATLPNLSLLADWLNAALYITEFRPIPLFEQFQVKGEIYDNQMTLVRKLPVLAELETDTDNILQLCLETIQNSCSVLIFCPTKNWCENLGQQLATAIWKLGTTQTTFGKCLRDQLNTDFISEVLEQLRRCPVGLDKILEKTISFGVAFHHAGLTMDERDIVEGAFRSSAIRILVATSTLSSGVNLPARRVIIRTPIFHGKSIDHLTYRQMIGRAGRMGKDTAGESLLICQKNDYRIVKELMSAKLKPIESCLTGSGKLTRAILEVVASGVVSTSEDVLLFTTCTLFANEEGGALQNPIQEALEFLKSNQFLRLQILEDGSEKYVATSLGKACLSSSMPPEEGLALFVELEKARQCFVLETELHLVYLVTPYSACNQWGNIDWIFFLSLWEKLPPSMKRVGNLVGIHEAFLVNASRGRIQNATRENYHISQVHKRFYVALALQDLVNEVPLNDVATKFNCPRGTLQSLQQSASTFAGMVTSFSKQLGWSSVEILISQFQDRLHFGVNRDLLDLMRLPVLNGPRARALYNVGIETLVQLASASADVIENALHKMVPFESVNERDGETKHDADQRHKLRNIWITGKQGLTEKDAANMLIEDARQYLQWEMGLVDAKWETGEDVTRNTTLNKSKCIDKSLNKITNENAIVDKVENAESVVNQSNLLKEIQKSSKKNNSNKTTTLVPSNENESYNSDILEEDAVPKKNTVPSPMEENISNKTTTLLPTTENESYNSDIFEEDIVPKKNTVPSPTEENISNKTTALLPSTENEPYIANIFQADTVPKKKTTPSPDESYNSDIFEADTVPNETTLPPPRENVPYNSEADSKPTKAAQSSPTENESYNSDVFETNSNTKVEKQNCHILNKSSNFVYHSETENKKSQSKSVNSSTENIKINWSNDSLFENSFESLDINKMPCSNLKERTNVQEENQISALESDTFLEKAFCSNFNLAVLTTPDCETPVLNKSLESSTPTNTSNECVFSSQPTTDLTPLKKINTTRINSSNKKRRRSTEDIINSNSDNSCLAETPIKRTKTNRKTKSLKKRKSVKPSQNIDVTFIISQNSTVHTLPYQSQQENSADLTKLEIIDVCEHQDLFKSFCRELRDQRELSLSVGCIKIQVNKPKIGDKILNVEKNSNDKNTELSHDNRQIKGVSLSWGGNTAYYISFDANAISFQIKISLLTNIFNNRELKVKMFDCKEQIRFLKLCLGLDVRVTLEDAKVADWLLDPEAKEKNLQAMALKYSPEVVKLAQLSGNCKGTGSVGLDLYSSITPRIRSSVEAISTWHVVNSILDVIAEQEMKLLHAFYIEMETILVLSKMELCGICVNKSDLLKLADNLKEYSKILEQKAYKLSGRQFSLSSPIEVAKVLGMFKGRRVSTSKQVLEQNDNPIAALIVQWRKLNCTLTKMIYPFINMVQNERIYGTCITFTATGRISMHEPNLQSIPREFEFLNPLNDRPVLINCRNVFKTADNLVLISADYCQLELRLLAHLSKDINLCSIMRTKEDVFKSIAAKLNNINGDEVTDELRQRAKQICYGIIYGMGLRSLADQLNSTEEEAAAFLEEFHRKYPSINEYVKKVIKECKEEGYVETIAGRRRYLPNIKHEHSSSRSQAERQAVNTTIQGSAADIAKNAMVLIDTHLQNKFKSSKNKPRLILHLHDEFLYEVPEKYANVLVKILKNCMVNSVKLDVPFPVKIKQGKSWGSLKEIKS